MSHWHDYGNYSDHSYDAFQYAYSGRFAQERTPYEPVTPKLSELRRNYSKTKLTEKNCQVDGTPLFGIQSGYTRIKACCDVCGESLYWTDEQNVECRNRQCRRGYILEAVR